MEKLRGIEPKFWLPDSYQSVLASMSFLSSNLYGSTPSAVVFEVMQQNNLSEESGMAMQLNSPSLFDALPMIFFAPPPPDHSESGSQTDTGWWMFPE